MMSRLLRVSSAAVCLILLLASVSGERAALGAEALSALDVIELEICYTTMMSRYYKPVSGAQLLGGARAGMISYMHARGITDPALPIVPATISRYRAEDEAVHFVGLAIARYGPRIEATKLVNASCAGELSSVNDRYTVLFHPNELKSFNTYLDGRAFGGIGVEFTTAQNRFVVATVFPASPAERAGLLENDRLTTLDGQDVSGLTPEQLRVKLRGRVGTAVSLGIERNGQTLPAPITVVRAEIAPPDVVARLLPSRVGYVQLRVFGGNSANEMSAALSRLRGEGATAYVLDLRNNGGGYRDQAIDIASHFVSGPVVSVAERLGKPAIYKAKSQPPLGAPLAVLINGNTASGSEIVAGAIQDDSAGTLVGERTFGKGLVQEVYPLPDGSAMKITTARYFTPAGRDIDGRGITPDLAVAQPPDAKAGVPGSDPQLDAAMQRLAQQASVPAR